MKKLAFLGGAAALGAVALLQAPFSQAADHLDAPTIAMGANNMADINDVYAWMTTDATKVNLALTVSPADDGNQNFGDSVQYVFHVQSHPGFLQNGVESKVICTFESNTNGSCWVVDPNGQVIDYVTGDFTTTAGKLSDTGKFRVFAGQRSDPFFFNLSGFNTAVETVRNVNLTTDAAGCPQFNNGNTPNALRTELQAIPNNTTVNGPCAQGERDCFLPFNVMAIVVQVDKSELIHGTDKLVSVWASTHAAP